MIQKIDKIDEFLEFLESSLHGKEGDNCTDARILLSEIKDYITRLENEKKSL